MQSNNILSVILTFFITTIFMLKHFKKVEVICFTNYALLDHLLKVNLTLNEV